jgi:hypothetical protein
MYRKLLNSDRFFVFLSLLIVLVTYHSWFFSNSILTFGDWGYYLPESQKELLRQPLVWNSAGLGFVDIGLAIYPMAVLLWGILAQFFDYQIVSRIVYFFPSVLFGVFGSYILNRRLGLSPLGSFVGMLVFNFNTYILLGRTGHLTLMSAFGVTPFVLYFFIRTLDEKKIYLSLITGLFGVLTSFYEVRAFYLVFFLLLGYLVYFLYINKYYSFKLVLRYFGYAFLSLVVYLLLNSFWIVGLIQTGGTEESGVVGRALFGEGYMNILRAITLFQPFWSYSKELIFVAQPVPLYFWMIPFFALCGLISGRKKHIVLFFGILSLIGVFLTKQSGQPFPDIYRWLYNYFPGFNAFRESSKFYFLTALGFSFLIGYFSDFLVLNRVIPKYFKIILLSLIIGVFLINTKPFITTEIGKLFTAREIDNDYIILNSKINSQAEFFRTLWVPRESRWGTWTNNHPKLSTIDLVNTSWKKVNKYDEKKKGFLVAEQIESIFFKSYSDQLLDRAGVKYVIIPIQDEKNDDDFIQYYGEREYFINKTRSLPYLKEINLRTKELLVFENSGYQSMFSLYENKDFFNSDYAAVNLESKFINSTHYNVQINNLNKLSYLTFSNLYNPGWGIKIGDKISANEPFFDDSLHFASEDSLNTFILDPQYIRRNFDKSSYKENMDGSISFTLTVLFRPQIVVTKATILSVGAFLGIILLVFIFYKNKL